MGLTWVAALPLALYALGFIFYGRFLSRAFGLSDRNPTPAHKLNDGRDFVPTRPAILLGQHFAAIAAVGPIAGPILAGSQYGWLPGLLWIVLGAVFIGAVHDFSALVISIRHDARTIGDILKDYLGPAASKLFAAFIWLSLIYVIVVFTDLTAQAFVSRPGLGDMNFGPGVATSSLLYLGLAVGMGLALHRGGLGLGKATALFVPGLFIILWLGQKMPLAFPGEILTQQRAWGVVILAYCFAASLIPMWVLLQPRGYLGGFILYATFAAGLFGLFFGGHAISLPGVTQPPPPGGVPRPPLFPVLFTTIACGACSGFHGLVSSGTSSRQLERESHARIVGYGGMLLESLVAVIALATVMMLAPGSKDLGLGPDEIYARGLAHFMQAFGIPFAAGVVFGKLAFATFIYDTLDVATRLGRYVLQELAGLKGGRGAVLATLATILVPLAILFMTFHDPAGRPVPLWKLFWPAFGASNQLLAAMTLVGVTAWLKKEGRNYWLTGLPALFMCLVTLGSLFLIVRPWLSSLAAGTFQADPLGITGLALLALALSYLYLAARRLFARP